MKTSSKFPFYILKLPNFFFYYNNIMMYIELTNIWRNKNKKKQKKAIKTQPLTVSS